MAEKSLLELLNDGERNKSSYEECLRSQESAIEKFLSDAGYVYDENPLVPLFKDSEDDRLKQAEEKQAKASTTPGIVTSEYVQSLRNIMLDFLKTYIFGWNNDFSMGENGLLQVEIICSVHNMAESDSPASDKINLENHLEFMRNEGFKLEKNRFGDWTYPASQTNLDLIQNILKDRGAKLLKVELKYDTIYKVSFMLKPENIGNFLVDSEKVLLEVSDEINDDEYIRLQRLCGHLNSSISYAKSMKSMLATAGSLVESYFSEICEILNYNGTIRKRVFDRHSEARDKNQRIREISQNIANIAPETAKEAIKDAKDRFDGFLNKNIGLGITDFYIDQYGIVNVKISHVQKYFCKHELLSEEKTSKIFETTGDSRRNEDFYLLDTMDNKEKLEFLISWNIPSFEISEVVTGKNRGKFIIKHIKGYVRNFADLLALPKEPSLEEE